MRSHAVIVGYQGGASGPDAVAFASGWARASGDRLIVVTVHPGSAPVGIGRVDAEWVAAERAAAEALLADAKTQVPSDVQVSFERVDAASAAHGIDDLVEQEGSPLVVLGTFRPDHEARTFPGHTADRLFNGAGVPVAIIPHGYAESRGPAPLKRVACAFVDTPDGHVALDHATRIAAHLGAELRVLAVVPDTLVQPMTGDVGTFVGEQRKQWQQSLETALAEVGERVPVTGELLEGPVAPALTDLDPDTVDLLVCGSRGYGPVRRVLLGGISARVVRNSRVPVVVVPRG